MTENNSANNSAKIDRMFVWILTEDGNSTDPYAWVFKSKEDAYSKMRELVMSHIEAAGEKIEDDPSYYCKVFIDDESASLCYLNENNEVIEKTKSSWKIYDGEMKLNIILQK